MFKRYAFITGFFGSLLMFVAVNLALYLSIRHCCDFDGFAMAGFPLPWYTNGWIGAHPNVNWSVLAADVVVAVIVSCAVGIIIKWVFVKPNE
jgi:hypothetical protein